ncbi:MAG: metal-activated pyridoxal enzyme [Luteitalea sp.]|nr:metal-activated pyridoxal enzyme [Luteitalea sp.]
MIRRVMAADLPTPALLVDEEIFEANIAAASALLRGTAKTLRPHVKTHRTPALARRQLAEAVIGVTCATVGEMEVMADAGITDLLLANEVASTDKVQRIAALARRARVTVAVDDLAQIDALSAAAQAFSVHLDVLVDVDVGLRRCGLTGERQLLEAAAAVERMPALRLAGIMGYEGRLRASLPDRHEKAKSVFRTLAEVCRLLAVAGYGVDVVSGAGTSTLLEAVADPTITEIQAGTYALMEPDLEGLHLPFRCAVAVAATVISRSGCRAVVDAGRKTLGCEYGLPLTIEEGRVAVSISEEHTVFEWPGTPPPLGTIVLLRPSQVRTTFNLHDRAWVVGRDASIREVAVEARGRSQ